MDMPGPFETPRLLIRTRILYIVQMVLQECGHLVVLLGEHNRSLSCNTIPKLLTNRFPDSNSPNDYLHKWPATDRRHTTATI